jgi:hypothetical protein
LDISSKSRPLQQRRALRALQSASEVRLADERPTPAGERQQLVTEQTLRLVDKQIGRGEPPTAEEWQQLRGLAGEDPAALQLVDELQSVVQRFDAQLRSRYQSSEAPVDLPKLRQGLAHLIREIVRRKAGVDATPPREANRPAGRTQ